MNMLTISSQKLKCHMKMKIITKNCWLKIEEIETELSELLFLQDEGSKSDDETDGPIHFIKNIVEKVKKDFDGVVVDEEKKTFLSVLTKIFATLLSVKAENIEKIINLIKISLSTVRKSWSEQN